MFSSTAYRQTSTWCFFVTSWVFKVACLSHNIQQTWLLKSSMHGQHCKFQSSRAFLFNSNSGWRMQRLAEKCHEVLCHCHTFFSTSSSLVVILPLVAWPVQVHGHPVFVHHRRSILWLAVPWCSRELKKRPFQPSLPQHNTRWHAGSHQQHVQEDAKLWVFLAQDFTGYLNSTGYQGNLHKPALKQHS